MLGMTSAAAKDSTVTAVKPLTRRDGSPALFGKIFPLQTNREIRHLLSNNRLAALTLLSHDSLLGLGRCSRRPESEMLSGSSIV